jgi:hypothetical protein
MSFKDVLIALTTYPQPTPLSAVDDAVDLAAALGAKLSAIACEVKINVPGSLLGRRLLNVPAMIAGEAKKSATNAHDEAAISPDPILTSLRFMARVSSGRRSHREPDQAPAGTAASSDDRP